MPIPKPCISIIRGRKCGTLVRDGGSRCGEHRTEQERARQARQEYRRGYGSGRYKRARKAALVRDGYQCTRVVGGRRCEARAVEVHHLRALSEGGDLTDEGNLASVCFVHNPRGGKK